jgi:hypothetical protein
VLRRLESLDLSATQVTDAGLVNLEGMSQLRSLDLRGAHVTESGVTRLQKALPSCTIKVRFPQPMPVVTPQHSPGTPAFSPS